MRVISDILNLTMSICSSLYLCMCVWVCLKIIELSIVFGVPACVVLCCMGLYAFNGVWFT